MSIEKQPFGTLPDGRVVDLYTLKNNAGMTVEVINFGCRLIRVLTPDRNGAPGDVILGHRTLEEYYGHDFQGSLVGRYANRIAHAEFTIDGKTYHLAANDGENALHGGPGGYHQVLWTVADVTGGDAPSITFTHTSPDGDEGYPGKLEMRVVYTLSEDNALSLEYNAMSDAMTPINFTNHSYFNLSADPDRDVLDTQLKINADYVTAVDDGLIPTGGYVAVKGTPLDFTSFKTIGQDIHSDDPLVKKIGGYDHNYCILGAGMRKFAETIHPETGRRMEVFSDLPGMQLYTFNGGSPALGKNGKPYISHNGFCLETQFYPDSPHHASFPFAFQPAGVPFKTTTIYKFSVK